MSSSSLRRRAASSGSSSTARSNGATLSSSTSTPTASPTSTSSSATRHARSSGSSNSRGSSRSSASKKRRYVDFENRCRNPFCGAELENKKQRYCDGNKFCQLRRGLALLCAWPQAPESDHGDEHGDDTARGGATSTASAPTAVAAAVAAAAAAASGDKRPRSVAESPRPSVPTIATPSAPVPKKPRLTQRLSSVDSVASSANVSVPAPTTTTATPTATATPPVTPTAATATTTAQQVKAATIDVVPLGVGNRAGGGGRYVRSGNRTEINSSSMVRPPSFSRFSATTSTSTAVPVSASASTTLETPPTQANVPPPVTSSVPLSSAPPSRSLTRANSLPLPVTTTNRSRDPRVRTSTTSTAAATGASTGGDTATPVRKTMSAADYLNMNRHKDAAATPSSTGNSAKAAVSSDGALSAARPLERRPPLDRSMSSSSLLNAPPPSKDYTSSSSRPHASDDSMRPLRRAQSDTTAPSASYDAATNDRYLSYRPEQPLSHNPASRPSEDWHRPREADYGYDSHHHPQTTTYSSHAYPSANGGQYDHNSSSHNAYNVGNGSNGTNGSNGSNHHRAHDASYSTASDVYDRKPSHQPDHGPTAPTRAPPTASASFRAESHDVGSHTPRGADVARSIRPSAPQHTRAESLFASLLRPKFSHGDPFVKLILTRMASFLPEEKVGIKAVSYTTTTKRKLQFYLDYAKRVEECCGRLAKLTVSDGVARLTIAGREWLSIEGTSTMHLYHTILEQLYDESCRWRSVITELKTIHSIEMHTRPGRAIPGVSFLKFWSAMKNRDAKVACELDFQSSFSVGNNRFHWVFTIGCVEVGSGSANSKVGAFKDATSSAFAFLDALTILPPNDKRRVAEVDGTRPTSSPRTSSTARPSSADTASRHAKVSSSSSSSTRTTTSPRESTTSTSRASTGSASSTTAATSTSDRPAPKPSAVASSSSTVPTAPARRTTSSAVSRPSTEQIVDAPPAAERSVSDDEDDRMSISSKEDNSNGHASSARATAAGPSATAATTVKSTASASTTTPATAKVTATTVPPPAAAVAAATAPTPACRFCQTLQKLRPDMLCVKCLRQRN